MILHSCFQIRFVEVSGKVKTLKQAVLVFLFSSLFTVTCSLSFGQFTDRYWTFGDSSGIDFANLISPQASHSILRVQGSCFSICESSGNLLFYGGSPDSTLWLHSTHYKNGYVVNKNHQKMNNGDSLAADLTFQSMLTVPDPGNLNRFYVFGIGVTNTPIPGFYYSLVDLSYYNGLGSVIQKNVQLNPYPLTDGLTAVKHGNGRDWWIVFKRWDTLNNDFYFYLLTPGGLNGPFIQSIGSSTTNNITKMKFSKDGKHLFVVNPLDLIETHEFDRCTGLLSNTNTIQPESSIGPFTNYWSFAISAESTKLYVTSIGLGPSQDSSYLFQFDLNSGNILGSKDTLQSFVGPSAVGNLQLGPDEKIYLSCSYAANDCAPFYLYCDTTWYPQNMNISVINQPENLGSACDFQPYSFYLGGHRCYYGLPNNPNYELGPDSNSICDTLFTIVDENLYSQKTELHVFYHKILETAFVNANGLSKGIYTLTVFDLGGRIVHQETASVMNSFFTSNVLCNNMRNGTYFILIQNSQCNLTGKFVKY
jgi:hypothetical protein